MPTIAELPEFNSLDDVSKGHVTSLGFDKLDPFIAATTAAGKLAAFGSNPDELIRVPPNAAPEQLAPLWERLGVPKDAAGYQLTGVDESLAGEVRTLASELKLRPDGAAQLATWLANRSTAAAKADQERNIAAVQAAKGELTNTWGSDAGLKEFRASKALETFGWTADDVARMAGGNKDAYVRIMTNMAVLGDRMAEARLLGDGGAPGSSGAMTPDQATAKINQLQADPAFRARWLDSPDPKVRQGAIEELGNLQRIVLQARWNQAR